MILADETGNLDTRTDAEIIEVLAGRAPRRLPICDGRLVEPVAA